MKDVKEPVVILIVLFILMGFAYGPLKKAKENGSSQNASSIGTKTVTDNKDVAENIKDIKEGVKDLGEDLTQMIEESKRSPYYDKIRMSNISGLQGNDPGREYMTLSTNLKKGESVKITGWYLKSEVTGYYAAIGKAAFLPFPFTKTESDVILQRGDKVYLTKGFSPIGISFRTNKCTGYFEENRTFVPSLSLQCPRPKDESLPQFSSNLDRDDECIDIIKRIPRCRTKDSEFIRDLPDTVSQTCKNYITEQINYNSCVSKHLGDPDFPGNEYRIYLGKFGPLWRKQREKINLHDQNGLIVDTIEIK